MKRFLGIAMTTQKDRREDNPGNTQIRGGKLRDGTPGGTVKSWVWQTSELGGSGDNESTAQQKEKNNLETGYATDIAQIQKKRQQAQRETRKKKLVGSYQYRGKKVGKGRWGCRGDVQSQGWLGIRFFIVGPKNRESRSTENSAQQGERGQGKTGCALKGCLEHKRARLHDDGVMEGGPGGEGVQAHEKG